MTTKQLIGLISSVQLVNKGSPISTGYLQLVKDNNAFGLIFIQQEDLPSARVLEEFLDFGQNKMPKQFRGFSLSCKEIETLSFKESNKKNTITMILVFKKEYEFEVSVNYIFEVSNFIEALLVNGIAVPLHNKDIKYSFHFYKNSHGCIINCPPFGVLLSICEFDSIESFWKKIMDFYVKFLMELFLNSSLPNDPYFPYGISAVSAQFLVEEEIKDFVNKLPKYEPLKREEFNSMFDEYGVIKDKEKFVERLYFGVDNDVLKDVLPYALGYYPLSSSSNERAELVKKRNEDFHILEEQIKSIGDYQLSHNKKLSGSFRVISHDVERTDRGNPAFIKSNGPGLKLLTLLLRMYCLYNMKIGYLQGMNDLFVPIILTYFPKWNKDGIPVDDNDKEININDYSSEIFWCYESMINNINHLELLSDIKQQCTLKAKIIVNILRNVSPMIYVWLNKFDLSSLLWIYSDFVLLYKRTYSNIWDVWIQLNCSKQPKNWLLYFISAIIILIFPALANLKEVNITTVMSVFPTEVEKLNPKEIGKVALWIYQKSPLLDEEKQEKTENSNNFKYFRFK